MASFGDHIKDRFRTAIAAIPRMPATSPVREWLVNPYRRPLPRSITAATPDIIISWVVVRLFGSPSRDSEPAPETDGRRLRESLPLDQYVPGDQQESRGQSMLEGWLNRALSEEGLRQLDTDDRRVIEAALEAEAPTGVEQVDVRVLGWVACNLMTGSAGSCGGRLEDLGKEVRQIVGLK